MVPNTSDLKLLEGLGTWDLLLRMGLLGVSGPFQNEWKCLACKRMARMDHVLTIKGPIKFHLFQSSLSGVTPPHLEAKGTQQTYGNSGEF